MRDATTILIVILVVVSGVLFAVAPRLSDALVRARAKRLPMQLALRMEEEWRGELNAITSRPGKLAFAIALLLTRRRSFVAPGEDLMTETHDRVGFAIFGGWKTLVIVPTLVFGLASAIVAYRLPSRYASEALILVTSQDVPRDLVYSFPEIPIEQRLRRYEQMIKSRSSLVSIIEKFQLLKKDRFRSMEGAIEDLRSDITLSLSSQPEDGQSGEIRLLYVASDRETAQQIAHDIINILVQQDLQARFAVLEGSKEFLQSEVDKLALQLTEQGSALARERAIHGPSAGGIMAMDYELLQSTYKTRFAKLQEVQMAVSLEGKQRGRQLVVVDPPNLPLEPIGPNRRAIVLLGTSTGFVLGSMAAFGLYRRQRRMLARLSA